MKTKTLLLFLLISVSAAAQNGKDISYWVGGSSIFENNKIYGKVKTIENITYVTDTNSYIFTKIIRQKTTDLHFVNYFLAFDTATNIVERKVVRDTISYHKKFSYNDSIVFEYDLLKNTTSKFICENQKRQKILTKEWTDSTNTPRRCDYSYSDSLYSPKNKKWLISFLETVKENDSLIAQRQHDYKFYFDNNSNKLSYRRCYWNPKRKYTKEKKYHTFISANKDSVTYKNFIFFNKKMQATKYEETLNGKKTMEIFYEYDYNLLQNVTKNYYNLNSKSIYNYNSRGFLIRKELFNNLKSKTSTETYNFYYEFDIHGNWVKMFDYNTSNILVERKITYYE
jgi:hypothetical protein